MIPAVKYPKPAEIVSLGREHAFIEASAGTGKTYVLEHLVVDLLLTVGARIDQILVVTFTEKATAELIVRLRVKIRQLVDLRPDDEAARAAAKMDDGDCWIIDEEARRKLRQALSHFGEAPISTIHGFCQRILQEGAFSNRRFFDEKVADEGETFHAAFIEALRHDVLADSQTRSFVEAWLYGGNGVDRLSSLLFECHRAMARLFPVDEAEVRPQPLDETAFVTALRAFPMVAADHAEIKAWLKTRKVHAGTAKAVLVRLAKISAIAGKYRQDQAAATALAELEKQEGSDGALFGYLREKLPAEDTADGGPDGIFATLRRLEAAMVSFAAELVRRVLPLVLARLARRKRDSGVFDFQDMLALVAGNLAGDGPGARALLASLRARYRFALVDEFQDTDEVQWSIFRRIFLESTGGHVLTVVGDPKQAIYGFRGADVYTYLRASRQMRSGTYLTRNFRSTPQLIEACNEIFNQKAVPPFFRAGGPCTYDHPVEYGHRERRPDGDVAGPSPSVVVLDIVPRQEGLAMRHIKQALLCGIAGEIGQLLAGLRPVVAKEIFVLTRTGRESREVGEALAQVGIPFAYFKQESLFDTGEAQDVLDLLRAIADPDDRSARGRAWLTPFFGWNLPDLAAAEALPADHPAQRMLFSWKAMADAGDVPGMLARIVAECGITRRELFLRHGERGLTNYLHILEILQEEATRTAATIRDLAATLGAYVAGTRRPPGRDEIVQRLPTDADAVQIMTCHHAKGLEADVVFLYGGFRQGPSNNVSTFHERGKRVVRIGRPTAAEDAIVAQERDDEERRVLYVALTRARARLVLPRLPQDCRGFTGPYCAVNDRLHAIAHFKTIEVACPAENMVAPAAPGDPQALAAWNPWSSQPAKPDFAGYAALAQSRAGFLITSYSAQKRLHGGFIPAGAAVQRPADGDAGEPDTSNVEAEVDADDLPRGRLSGIFLHEVLEEIDLPGVREAPTFDAWQARPDVAALFDRCRRHHGRSIAYAAAAQKLVYGALTSPVRLGNTSVNSLARVEHPLREMEFLFPIPEKHHPSFSSPLGGNWKIERGCVKGFIDFLFEHEGRAYVCDWKSDHLSSWQGEGVADHCERNYALQARIYTVATLRMLGVAGEQDYERRFGGVVYYFLRGVAAGAGVYFQRPAWAQVLAWEKDMLAGPLWGLA